MRDIGQNKSFFLRAEPIWPVNLSEKMNVQVGFSFKFVGQEAKGYRLNVTGATLYRIFLNGNFLHYGPARAPHGYMRVDEIDLKNSVKHGENHLFIEVAGYHCGSYYTLKTPSFLMAEVREDGSVIGFTGGKSFKCFRIYQREQKTVRYSHARTFTEIYTLDNSKNPYDFTTSFNSDEKSEIVGVTNEFLPRGILIPDYKVKTPAALVGEGALEKDSAVDDRSWRFPLEQAGGKRDSFELIEITCNPYEEIKRFFIHVGPRRESCPDSGIKGCPIGEAEYAVFDMGINNTGFISTEMLADEDSEVCFVFDEKLVEGKINPWLFAGVNVLKYNLKKSGKPYRLESFECYVFRYIACVVLRGRIILHSIGLREYSHPQLNGSKIKFNDKQLEKIYTAAFETFRQNTLDVFMDNPSRERGGWLCDSYFTAQASHLFSGDASVEKVMVENYLYPDFFPGLPEGMLPHCYPSEYQEWAFIPQWGMWYFVQLDDYFRRSGETNKNKFKKLAYGFLSYLKPFRNSDGLLENLEGWSFVEWSKANRWVKDVNYPTNMLYSKMLQLIGGWYGDRRLLEEAEKLRKTIIEHSFDGNFFRDNAVREEDGSLRLTANTSEVCQYYAYFFEVALPEDERFAGLKETVLNVFGPDRKKKKIMPNLTYANLFIGIVLRMEILLRWGEYKRLLNEIKSYFLVQAELTGTLWEDWLNYADSINFFEETDNGSVGGVNSLNQGFASFVGAVVFKVLSGVKLVDNINKTVAFDFGDLECPGMEASISLPQGKICVWRRALQGKEAVYFSLPEGFRCLVANDKCFQIMEPDKT